MAQCDSPVVEAHGPAGVPWCRQPVDHRRCGREQWHAAATVKGSCGNSPLGRPRVTVRYFPPSASKWKEHPLFGTVTFHVHPTLIGWSRFPSKARATEPLPSQIVK
jgi:hypothetical protein